MDEGLPVVALGRRPDGNLLLAVAPDGAVEPLVAALEHEQVVDALRLADRTADGGRLLLLPGRPRRLLPGPRPRRPRGHRPLGRGRRSAPVRRGRARDPVATGAPLWHRPRMSLNSMTGFGRAATTIDGAPHTVEIKAVNHRYLDVKIRLPRALAPLEVEVGRRVRATLGRGRIEVTISGGGGEAGVANDVAVDLGLARRLLAAVEELGAELDLPGKPDVAFVAQWPGVPQPVVRDVDPADPAGARCGRRRGPRGPPGHAGP
ncbi:MAG: YicC/YloC family endoribonuclease [bacterium]